MSMLRCVACLYIPSPFKDSYGNTALITSIKSITHAISCVRQLLHRRDVDIYPMDNNGNTALMNAEGSVGWVWSTLCNHCTWKSVIGDGEISILSGVWKLNVVGF